MRWLVRALTSHTGRKVLAAVTGLGLVAFLIVHLIGNLQIYSPTEAFNDYAKNLHSGPLIVLGDVGLAIAFPLHIGCVIWLALDNKKARGGQGYKVVGTKQKRSFAEVLASKTTLYGGLVLLVFVVIHVLQFRIGHDVFDPKHPLREALIETLKKPGWALLYIVGSLVVGWHLFHGIQAAFRSLGAWHSKYTPIIVKTGLVLSIILALGFASIPAWILIAQP